jgi:hypothetical protein
VILVELYQVCPCSNTGVLSPSTAPHHGADITSCVAARSRHVKASWILSAYVLDYILPLRTSFPETRVSAPRIALVPCLSSKHTDTLLTPICPEHLRHQRCRQRLGNTQALQPERDLHPLPSPERHLRRLRLKTPQLRQMRQRRSSQKQWIRSPRSQVHHHRVPVNAILCSNMICSPACIANDT